MSPTPIGILGLKPAAWLGIVGGVLEILGFGLVAVELVRAQRRELGTAGPFQFLLTFGGWVERRWRELLGKTRTHEASATLTGATTVTGRGKARTGGPPDDITDRVRVLEENFRQLDAEVDQHREELDRRIDGEAEARQTALRDLRLQLQVREEEHRSAFADSARLQWLGIGLFVLGAIASAMANVVGAA